MADKGKVNYDTFVMRHGLFRNLPKGKLGEPLYCTDTHELYIGQGEDKAPIPVVAQGGSGTDVNGMFFSVDTIAERDALKYTYNIQNGAMCYVAQEDMYYKYSNGEWGEANFGTGGGGTTGSLTSEMAEDLTLSVNSDLQISYFFSSPNAGKGNLKVFIDGVEAVSESVSQGAGVVTILENNFTKGKIHTLVMYVIDRAEIFTNSLTFYVTYGGLEISTTFDSASSYDVGSIIRCYYTPTSVKTLPIKLHVKIDGELQEPVNCTANTRNTYTFPRTLDAGSHNIQMWVEDADGMSNVLMFALILLSSDSLVITSSKSDVEAEEGDQVSLDYKVSMKNQTAFNTKYYVDEVLLQSGTCGVVKTAWNTSTLTKGTHKLMLYVETQAKGEDGVTPLATATYTWNVVIVESSYQIIKHNTAGLVAGFTAKDRVNTANDKEYWVGTSEDGNEVIAELFNYGYDNTCGWVDNSLMSNGMAYTKIPVRPLATNGGKQGVTVEIEFSAKDIGVEDAVILDCYDTTKDCGIKITKDRAIMKSFSGNSLNLDYSEQTNTHIVLVLDRLNKMAKGYINGVLCEAFYLSDTGEGDGAVLEDFAVDKDVYINGLMTPDGITKVGWSKVKNVRFYNVALTSEEVVQNFLANITDKDAQRLKSQFQRGSTLPTMTFTGSTKGMGKGSPKTMKITYNSTDEIQYGKSFELKNCSVEWQGTSSLQYVVKNYKIKLKDDSGNKYKYNPYGEANALPESTFCLKADYMESSHANNTGLAKFITKYLYEGETIDYCPPRQSYTGVRDTITGFPIRLIINDVQDNGETITKDMGIFNFNLDKGCTNSFGLDTEKYPNCMSYEVVANSDVSAGAFFSYGYQVDSNTIAGSEFDTELEYLQNSFELRYPDDKVVGADYGYISNLKRVIDWVCSMPVETAEQKKAFRDQFPNYFDKGYTLRYLLCVLVFGMVDNLGKNMMLDTWDGQIWYPRFYDLDTSFGLDNSGVLRFDSDIEIQAGTFNTSKSQLWSKVMIAFENELRTEYQYMRSGKFNVENIMEFMYGEQISKIPESYYNSDAQTKYLDFGALYLSKLHGNRYEHMKRWIRRRLLYVDTLLNYTSTTDDSITVRAGTLQLIQFKLETFEPQYVRIKWKNGDTRKYRCNGKTPTICEYTLDTETDQEILIYNASNLKRLSGLSSAVPESMDLANAVRLSELEVHSTKLKNINGTVAGGVNVSSMSNLSKINLKGCTALEGALNVAGCTMLRYINIQDTNMADVQLPPTGAALQELWYSKTIQTISLSNAPNLKILGLQMGHACKNLTVVNCPKIETFGDREWNPSTQTYKYTPWDFLEGVQSLHIDNSLGEYEVMGLPHSIGLFSITLKNMPNLKRFVTGASMKSNNPPTGISDPITVLDSKESLSVVATNCPKFKEFIVCSWSNNDMVGDIITNIPNSDGRGGIEPRYAHFVKNTLDFSQTTLENIDFRLSTVAKNLILPTTVKILEFCNLKNEGSDVLTSLSLDNNTVSKKEKYMYSDIDDVEPGSYHCARYGHFICNVWSPATTETYSVGTAEYNNGIWDFEGLNLTYLNINQMGRKCGSNYYDNSTAYAPKLKNLNLTVTDGVAPSLRIFSVGGMENCNFNYENYVGRNFNSILSNIRTRGDNQNCTNVTVKFPKNPCVGVKYPTVECNTPMQNTNTDMFTWQDAEKIIPYTPLDKWSGGFANVYLKEQESEAEKIDIINPLVTYLWHSNWNSLIPPFGWTNLKYIGDVLLENCTHATRFFWGNTYLVSVDSFRFKGDESASSNNVYQCTDYMFYGCTNLEKVGTISMIKDNAYNISTFYLDQPKLKRVEQFAFRATEIGRLGGNLFEYAGLPSEAKSLSGLSYKPNLQWDKMVIPNGITSMVNCFRAENADAGKDTTTYLCDPFVIDLSHINNTVNLGYLMYNSTVNNFHIKLPNVEEQSLSNHATPIVKTGTVTVEFSPNNRIVHFNQFLNGKPYPSGTLKFVNYENLEQISFNGDIIYPNSPDGDVADIDGVNLTAISNVINSREDPTSSYINVTMYNSSDPNLTINNFYGELTCNFRTAMYGFKGRYNQDTLNSLVSHLGNVTSLGGRTLTLGANVTAQLSESQITEITNKGWTIV